MPGSIELGSKGVGWVTLIEAFDAETENGGELREQFTVLVIGRR